MTVAPEVGAKLGAAAQTPLAAPAMQPRLSARAAIEPSPPRSSSSTAVSLVAYRSWPLLAAARPETLPSWRRAEQEFAPAALATQPPTPARRARPPAVGSRTSTRPELSEAYSWLPLTAIPLMLPLRSATALQTPPTWAMQRSLVVLCRIRPLDSSRASTEIVRPPRDAT